MSGDGFQGSLPGLDAALPLPPGLGDPKALEQYFTPPWLAERFVEWAAVAPGCSVIEPSAGDGAILGPAVARLSKYRQATAVELDGGYAERLRRRWPDVRILHADFLTVEPWPVDLVLGNVPFSIGAEMLRHALRFAPRVCSIIGNGMLHTEPRYRLLWKHFQLNRLVYLCNRVQHEGPANKDVSPSTNFALVELLNEPRTRRTEIDWWP